MSYQRFKNLLCAKIVIKKWTFIKNAIQKQSVFQESYIIWYIRRRNCTLIAIINVAIPMVFVSPRMVIIQKRCLLLQQECLISCEDKRQGPRFFHSYNSL